MVKRVRLWAVVAVVVSIVSYSWLLSQHTRPEDPLSASILPPLVHEREQEPSGVGDHLQEETDRTIVTAEISEEEVTREEEEHTAAATTTITTTINTPLPSVSNKTLDVKTKDTVTETSDNLKSPIIDVLSIGSTSRLEYLQTQQALLQPFVRHFWPVTEANDTAACRLTRDQAQQVATFCKINRQQQGDLSVVHRRRQAYADWKSFLANKPTPQGWLCAQKRPNDGLQFVLEQYHGRMALPDYLVVLDDDTYIDLPQVTAYLEHVYPRRPTSSLESSLSTSSSTTQQQQQPLVMAGCLIRFRDNMTLPWGGWGTILNKEALVNLAQRPIECGEDWKPVNHHPNDDDSTLLHRQDAFVENACHRLRENQFGEQVYFRNGTTLAALIQAYVTTHDFDQIAEWSEPYANFCVHSDWIWAYFFNFYQVGSPVSDPFYHDDRSMPHAIASYRLSQFPAAKQGGDPKRRMAMEGQCRFKGDQCPPEAHICHYVTPEQMNQKHSLAQANHPPLLSSGARFLQNHDPPIPVFVFPFLNHTIEHELKHFLWEGVQRSSKLALTLNYTTAPIWVLDARRAGLESMRYCSRVMELLKQRPPEEEKPYMAFVYWEDTPWNDFVDCYRVTRFVDSTRVRRFKRSVVQDRRWNETLQFVEYGRRMEYGNWRDHSGGPVAHISYGVRSDLLRGMEEQLHDKSSLWTKPRPWHVSHFWPMPGRGSRDVQRGYQSRLRDSVSRTLVQFSLTTDLQVFVGLAGQADEDGRNHAQTAYMEQLLASQMIVVSQKDAWEDHYRLMEALISGAMVLTDPMVAVPQHLQDGESVVFYRSLEDLVDKIRYYLENEAERLAIAQAGYRVAMEHHRSWHMMERIVYETLGL